jgi:hypothetical protein
MICAIETSQMRIMDLVSANGSSGRSSVLICTPN